MATGGLKKKKRLETRKLVTKKKYYCLNVPTLLKSFKLYTMVCQGCALTATKCICYEAMKHGHGVHTYADLCPWDKTPVPTLHTMQS